MASDSEVIRAFLVSVGVEVDEKGLKRFDEHVDKITKTVTTLAKAAAAAALAVSAATVKIADQFEDLFYASQRLKSSVDNIKAFSFGVSQMGGDAKAARNSLESFASFMRSNPMGEGVVRGLGVETRDAAGNAREYADVLRDVGAQLRNMPYWAAKQRANLLGIDENTLQALMRGTDLWSDRYRKMVAESGVNMDQMAADMASLMQYFRDLRAEIEIYFYKALTKINPEILKLSGLIAAVGGALAVVAALLGPEVAAVLALAGAIAFLVDDFNKWKSGAESFVGWDKWADQIDEVVDYLRQMGAGLLDIWDAVQPLVQALVELGKILWAVLGPMVGPIIRATLDLIIDGLHFIADVIRLIIDLMTFNFAKSFKDNAKVGADMAKIIGDGLMGLVRAAAAAAHGIERVWYAFTHKGAKMPEESVTVPAPGPSRTARAKALAGKAAGANDNVRSGGTPASRSAQQQAVDYFMRQGWTREQAQGIVAGSFAESGLDPTNRNPTSGAYGIGQWLSKDRVSNFQKVIGKPLEGSSFTDQLAFMQWELRNTEKGAGDKIARSGSASGALDSFVRDYERPAQGLETDRDLIRGNRLLATNARLGTDGGSRTVTINSKTDVKVTGAGSPKETGKAVGDAVDRQNANLVRNTRTAVR